MTREEAINNLKKVLGFSPTYDEAFYTLFPALKESEDERIMDTLIEHFKGFSPIKVFGDFDFTSEQILAYLEKQKEQKPVEWSDEDEEMIDSINRSIGSYMAHIRTECAILTDKDKKRILDRCENECAWLEDRLKHFRPQPKQEWSEEETKDLVHILKVLDDCYAYGKHDLSKTDHDNLTSTIKSLRPSWKPTEVCYGAKGDPDPAGVWKPSEEQMEALKEVVFYFGDSWVGKKQDNLESLYEQLKKL